MQCMVITVTHPIIQLIFKVQAQLLSLLENMTVVETVAVTATATAIGIIRRNIKNTAKAAVEAAVAVTAMVILRRNERKVKVAVVEVTVSLMTLTLLN